MNLNKTLECQADVEFQKEIPIYVPFEGKVLHAYVKVGDDVEWGDLLYQLDIGDIEKELQMKEIELKKVEVSLKLQADKVSSINEKLNELILEINKEQEKQDLIDHNKELEIIEAQELVTVNDELYKSNLISESELRKSQIAL